MQQEQAAQSPKRSKKPFIFGCLGGGCLALVLSIAGFTWYWVSWAKSIPEDQPTVEPVPFNQEKFESLGRRYDDFRRKVAVGEVDEMVLTEDEINLVLSKWAKEGKDAALMQVSLEGSTARGKASIPITKDGHKKWVNCEFAVDLSVQKGALDVQIKELKIKDKTFGEKGVMAKPINQLKEDALSKFHADPNARRQLEKIESITVRDGKVYLKVKKGTELDALPPSK